MKIRGLIIAAFVLLMLSGFLYWSEHRKPGDNAKISADSPPAILKLDQAAITSLELKKKDAEPIQLTKADSGEWRITQPKPLRADQNTVSSMLSTVSSLNSERLVEDKASNLKTYGLEQPALEVDIGEKGNKSQKLVIGDDTPASGGVYAMLADEPRVFTMSSYNKTSLDKSLNDLRDKRLLTVNADKISRVELIGKNEDIEFGRNKDEWQILKPKPLRADSTQVGDLVRVLTDAKIDLSGSDTKSATSAFVHATPVASAQVTDESGTQELQVRKRKDTYYSKSSAVEGAYKVDAALAKALDKGLDDFRNKKLFDFGYSEPNKIELHNGAKSYFLTRGSASSEDWWSNGKKIDATSVESLISKLRDLSVSKFAESGFSSSTIEAVVTSDDGKRTEKVLISKSGDHYLAKRENEPALYQLDSSSIDALLKAADDVKPHSSGGETAPKQPQN
jgi:uncharacterized protein DUF4340